MTPGKITLLTKMAYGVGQTAESIKNTSFELFLFFYYNQVLGLSGTLAGTAVFIALCVDAFTDPLFGYISDQWRSRWGRRHPWMYVSAIPLAVGFYFLFAPPAGLNQIELFLWLTALAVAVRLAMTLYYVPYLALGAELSDDYDERTTVVGYRTAFWLLGSTTLIVISFSVFFAGTVDFPNGQLNRDAYPAFGLFFAIVMWAAIWCSAAGTHRAIPFLTQPERSSQQIGAAALLRDVGAVLQNRPFRILLISVILFSAMRGVQNTLSLHTTTYFWALSPNQIQIVTLALMLGFLAGIPLCKPLSRRFDKKPLFIFGISWALIFHVGPIVLRLLNWLPDNGEPALIGFLVIASILGGMGAVQAIIVAGSMLADITDMQRLSTGQYQTGLFFGGLALAGKAASGLGHSIAGIGLDLIHFPANAQPETVSTDMLRNLALVMGPGVSVIGLLALLIFLKYPLNRQRILEIQAKLRAQGES